jgi:hypothetical protein
MHFNFDDRGSRAHQTRPFARWAVRSGLTLTLFGMGGLILFELAAFARDYLHALNG